MSENQSPADSNPELPSGTSWAAERIGSVRDDGAVLPAETSLSRDDRLHLADQLWLDSLLTQVLRPGEATHRDVLIGRVMQSIHNEPKFAEVGHPPRNSRRAWMTSLASLAAAIVLGWLFLSPHAGPKSALAAVERSLQAAAEDVDRQYRILMTKPDADSPLPITLTVRGATRFVWEQPVVLGTTRVGSNGDEYWMVPSIGPVMVAAEGSLIERLLSEKQMTTPILTLTTSLEWLRDRYELELLPEEEISSGENPNVTVRCEHIRGILRNSTELLKPQRIDLWSDRSSGVVERLTMEWPAGVRFGPLHGDVRLQATPHDLPADWYSHAHHHAANRVVIRRPPP